MNKDSAAKTLLYVGGLADEIDERVLQAAFIPFGDIVRVEVSTSLSARFVC